MDHEPPSRGRTKTARAPSGLSDAALALRGRLARISGERGAGPDKALGQEIARDGDAEAVAALIELLADRAAESSAIKALYECGYLAPELLVPHADTFLALLRHKRNRLVWGGAIAVACVARAAPDVIWPRREEVIAAFEPGTVITRDGVVHALAAVAASAPTRARALAPWFAEILCDCPPRDMVSYAERVMPALAPDASAEVGAILAGRQGEVTTKTASRKLARLLKRHGEG